MRIRMICYVAISLYLPRATHKKTIPEFILITLKCVSLPLLARSPQDEQCQPSFFSNNRIIRSVTETREYKRARALQDSLAHVFLC